MKIVVCVKQVPDTAAKVAVEGGRVTWGDAPLVMNPWDEYAVEAALQMQEKHGGTVTVVSVGEENTKETLKKALAMGCNDAILVSDPSLNSADSQAISKVLAAAIQKIGGVELAFFGRQAIDGDMGVTGPQTGRVLGWPVLSLVSSIQSVQGNCVRVERVIEEGKQVVETNLPAVMTVSKDIGEPRYASFMGIRKASKANIPTWGLGELGISAPQAVVTWPEVSNPPARQVTTEMITGSSPQEIAEKLADKILGEKVL